MRVCVCSPARLYFSEPKFAKGRVLDEISGPLSVQCKCMKGTSCWKCTG